MTKNPKLQFESKETWTEEKGNPRRFNSVKGNINLLRKNLLTYPGVFLGKDVLTICSKFAGEHPCRSVTSIKLLATKEKSVNEKSDISLYLWFKMIWILFWNERKVPKVKLKNCKLTEANIHSLKYVHMCRQNPSEIHFSGDHKTSKKHI